MLLCAGSLNGWGVAARRRRGVGFAWSRRPLAPLGRSFFFAWGKGAVELTVDEEIGQDATRRPGNPVRPSLDAGRRLLVDKDIAAHDQLIALPVVWTARTVMQDPLKARLKD